MTVQLRSGAVLALLLGGCSVVSPAPMMARHDVPQQGREGDVRILLVAGAGGGVFLDGGLGFALRASVQAAPDVEAGGDVSVAFNLEGSEEANHPQVLTSVRGFARYNPGGLDWLAVEGGAGAGVADTGLVWLTADVGALAGADFDLGAGDERPGGAVLLYGGPLVAVSIPVRDGLPLLERGLDGEPGTAPVEEQQPSTTIWYGASLGLGATSASALDLGSSLEAMVLGAKSGDDAATYFQLTLGSGAAFAP